MNLFLSVLVGLIGLSITAINVPGVSVPGIIGFTLGCLVFGYTQKQES